MAGAGYKLFNTGDVLTAQQVNEYLMQQTVMVFADASARTTALSGVLAEGMLSYLKSTDATEVYNGSAWVGIAADQTPLTTKGDLFTYTTTDARLASSNVNGDVLTVDTSTASGLKWAAPAAAGGITLISETTASALSSLSFSSISSTYDELLLVWDGLNCSDSGTRFNIRLNNDSSTNYYAKIFAFTTSGNLSSASGDTVSGNETSSLAMVNTNPSALEQRWAGTLRIFNYTSTSKKKRYDYQVAGYNNSTGANRGGFIIGTYDSLSAISSIDIVRTLGSGTFSNATDTSIRLYGIS